MSSPDDLNLPDSTPAITRLVPGKTDRDLAEEIKKRVSEKIDPLLAEMTWAKAQGFDVFLGIQTDAQGKCFLQQLKIVKEF